MLMYSSQSQKIGDKFVPENNSRGSENLLLIAIDGTAGVGKTTIGQMLAKRLHIAYLDTGAMYRAVTWEALQRGVALDPADAKGLANLSRTLPFVSRDATPQEASDGRQYTVLLNGEDVSRELRSPEVERWVSVVAAIPQVRSELVLRQREIARADRGIVMIGRDIGSVVLPDADLKIFLDASPEVRAQRRSQQAAVSDKAQTLAELQKRDQIDSQRKVSPLVVPQDAVYILTDQLDPQQVLAECEKALDQLLAKRNQ